MWRPSSTHHTTCRWLMPSAVGVRGPALGRVPGSLPAAAWQAWRPRPCRAPSWGGVPSGLWDRGSARSGATGGACGLVTAASVASAPWLLGDPTSVWLSLYHVVLRLFSLLLTGDQIFSVSSSTVLPLFSFSLSFCIVVCPTCNNFK